jgi:rhodanese-related sulfurtransferase
LLAGSQKRALASSRSSDRSHRSLRTACQLRARLVDSLPWPDHNTVVSIQRVSKEDVKAQLEGTTPPVLIDARLKYPYEHSTVRLPGAIRFTGEGPTPSLPRDRDIVVYDSDPSELASSHVAALLIRQGYRAVSLKGGIADWLTANLPTETKEAPKQAPPEPGALKS